MVRPALLFLHLHYVDHAGQKDGWGSVRYYRAMKQGDLYIGGVLTVLDEAGLADSTFVLVTSDHGGPPRGHGRNSLV